jgi:hypothetical protein
MNFTELSFSSLFAGFAFGVLGFFLIKQGRKKGHLAGILIGLVLLIFPYFISNPFLVWLIGLSLLFLAARMGAL